MVLGLVEMLCSGHGRRLEKVLLFEPWPDETVYDLVEAESAWSWMQNRAVRKCGWSRGRSSGVEAAASVGMGATKSFARTGSLSLPWLCSVPCAGHGGRALDSWLVGFRQWTSSGVLGSCQSVSGGTVSQRVA